MAKKIIAVAGATGSQGGGLVRAILADPSGEFTARALTRNIDSEKAKALAKLGAEVVETDVDDVESLKRAFKNAYGAFCVTLRELLVNPPSLQAGSILRRCALLSLSAREILFWSDVHTGPNALI